MASGGIFRPLSGVAAPSPALTRPQTPRLRARRGRAVTPNLCGAGAPALPSPADPPAAAERGGSPPAPHLPQDEAGGGGAAVRALEPAAPRRRPPRHLPRGSQETSRSRRRHREPLDPNPPSTPRAAPTAAMAADPRLPRLGGPAPGGGGSAVRRGGKGRKGKEGKGRAGGGRGGVPGGRGHARARPIPSPAERSGWKRARGGSGEPSGLFQPRNAPGVTPGARSPHGGRSFGGGCPRWGCRVRGGGYRVSVVQQQPPSPGIRAPRAAAAPSPCPLSPLAASPDVTRMQVPAP